MGCSKPKPAPVVPAETVVQPAAPAHAEVQAFVSGQGRGADEEAAYVAAQAQLAEALLGDARWLSVMPLKLHDRALDPYQAVSTDDGWEVAIGLEEGRTATALDAFTYARPEFQAPEPWHDALYEALGTHVAKVVCERRASLYAVACDAPSTEAEDASVRRLGTDLELTSLLQGGVPTDTDGTVLRPARVLVTWNGAPVGDLPLVVARADQRTHVRTNPDGIAELPVDVGAAWPGAFDVTVDAGRMMGPLEALTAWPTLDVQARPLDPRRWALVFEKGTQANGVFAQALRTELAGALGEPVRIDAATARTLGTVGPAERARVLVSLADTMAGRLDVVVLVRASSRFASRAGGSRVWFEGASAIVVHEVWGAGELGRKEVEATASGVGDKRADEAVRRELATQTSSTIVKVLRPDPK